MADNAEREQEEWLERLGVAIAASPEPPALGEAPSAEPSARADRATLPSWPWAISSLGLCLALLVVEPNKSEKSDELPQPKATTPQVHGWRGTASPSANWPDGVPLNGYHGIEQTRPQPAPQAAPVIAPSPPVAEIIPAPLTQLPPVNVAAFAPVPVPATTATAEAIAPASPQFPTLMPLGTPLPTSNVPQQKAPENQISPPLSIGDVSARPRKAASRPQPRERKPATPAATTDDLFSPGPIWVEKVFGPPRS
ncbi:MAG: hypothetical protein ABL904_04505 [Hyphomicrobiaceae bacterium]